MFTALKMSAVAPNETKKKLHFTNGLAANSTDIE
jgi:hypothetical protein